MESLKQQQHTLLYNKPLSVMPSGIQNVAFDVVLASISDREYYDLGTKSLQFHFSFLSCASRPANKS